MSELIFLDLEWNTTFYRNRKGERLPFHELIEVAAIKVEAGTGAMLDSFHSYVHPKASRKIDSRTYRLLPYAKAELSGRRPRVPGPGTRFPPLVRQSAGVRGVGEQRHGGAAAKLPVPPPLL